MSSSSSPAIPPKTEKPNKYIRYEVLIPTHDNENNRFPSRLIAISEIEIHALLGDITIAPDVNLGTGTMGSGEIAVDETLRIFAEFL